MQSVRARTILWIAERDWCSLPAAVHQLQAHGLEIRKCEDLRSYKKLIPALAEFPNTVLVTADDDVYYWRDWLFELLQEHAAHPHDIVCSRLHQFKQTTVNEVAPYGSWDFDVDAPGSDHRNFATGVGGILYPPRSLHPLTLRQDLFLELCPQGDDIWFFFMARMQHTCIRKSPTMKRIYCWRQSQAVALWHDNVLNEKNDAQFRSMVNRFGLEKMGVDRPRGSN